MSITATELASKIIERRNELKALYSEAEYNAMLEGGKVVVKETMLLINTDNPMKAALAAIKLTAREPILTSFTVVAGVEIVEEMHK